MEVAPSGAAQRTDEPMDGEDAPRFELVAHPDLHMGGWERCMRHRELVCRSSVRVRAAGQRLAGEAWAGGESSDAPPLAGPVSPLTVPRVGSYVLSSATLEERVGGDGESTWSAK